MANGPIRRIQGADGVRAFACLWVFAHHVGIKLDPQQLLWHESIHTQGSLGVAVFFVLSGMLLTPPFWQAALGQRPWPTMATYASARLGRIVPAYFVCLMVSLCLFADRTEIGPRLLSAVTFTSWMSWRTFFPAPINSPLWSISIEVCFYAMLPVWALGLQRVRSWGRGMVYLVATQIAIVVVQKLFFSSHREWDGDTIGIDPLQLTAFDWVPIKNPLGLFSHFLFGSAVAGVLARWPSWSSKKCESLGSRWNRFDALTVLCLLALAIEIYPAGVSSSLARSIRAAQVWCMSFQWPIFPALVSVLLLSLHYSEFLGLRIDNRWLALTARLSYGIYLWHMVVLELLARACPWSLESLPRQLIFAAVALGVTNSVAAASFYFLEQPFLRWLKSRNLVIPSESEPKMTVPAIEYSCEVRIVLPTVMSHL